MKFINHDQQPAQEVIKHAMHTIMMRHRLADKAKRRSKFNLQPPEVAGFIVVE
jgi:hypothetical protein